jgi:NAD(P)-dependent dehydrogenase (short-subunit alcohol dehydrogenase family)
VPNHTLIVGGSSGIGAALVETLVAHGHQVTHLSREPQKAPALDAVRGYRWDAVSEPFPTDCLPERLDGFVYCPGSIRLKPFARLQAQELRDDLELNLIGAVRALQASLEALKRSDQAAVVLFSTVAVRTGMPFHASVAAAKGAVEGLTRALAAELAPEVRVNAIAPTITDTPLSARLLSTEEKRRLAAERHPLKRIGTAQELAEMARWLLTDASMISGEVIAADAGLSALRMI